MIKQKNITILIPNATGPTNVGDQAILLGLLTILKNSFNKPKIIIHTSEPHKYKEKLVDDIDHHLYDWAAFDNPEALTRITKLSLLFLNYWMYKLNTRVVIGPERLKKLINDYQKADLIIFSGGGYLRSQKGFTQSLNLIMLLTMFKFANLAQAKKILSPISFGPFAYDWQEKLSAATLKSVDEIFAREYYSYKLMSKYNLKPVLGADLALLLPRRKSRRTGQFILGFTVRNWLKPQNQLNFEKSVADSLYKFSQKSHVLIQPIIHVDSPKYGDYDQDVTNRIISQVNKKGLSVLKTKHVLSVKSGLEIYSNLNMLLGMRMHSTIMAALAGVPFAAISYEYKTEGVSQSLGIENCVVKCEKANSKNLYSLLFKVYRTRKKLAKTINNSVEKIQKRERARWTESLQLMS